MKTLSKIIAITLFSLPLLSHAAGKSATAAMQVSFEVKESCTVQSTDRAPAVACQLKTTALTTRSAEPAAASSKDASAIRPAPNAQPAAGEVWTVYF